MRVVQTRRWTKNNIQLYFVCLFMWIQTLLCSYKQYVQFLIEVWPGFCINLLRVNQRWLWNFPEGPCSLCRFPPRLSIFNLSSCYNWLEGPTGWNIIGRPALCHTDHPVQAPSESIYLIIYFYCNAEISSAIYVLVPFRPSFRNHDSINLERRGV